MSLYKGLMKKFMNFETGERLMININLQLFADTSDKTEKATPKSVVT